MLDKDNVFDVVTFELTKEHIKLLSSMCVGWQDAEYGAPEINPKRPYGNSAVEIDMADILGIRLAKDEEGERFLSIGQSSAMNKLHKEMETALQVVLATRSFEPGIYAKHEYHRDWKLTKDTLGEEAHHD